MRCVSRGVLPEVCVKVCAAVVGGVGSSVSVEHGQVEQVVMETTHPETVLIVLPLPQDRCTAHPGQTHLMTERQD